MIMTVTTPPPASTGTGTIDSSVSVGLLILRIGTGAALLQAGLMKVSDFSTTVGFMTDAGWRLPTFAAVMVTASETLAGVGLLIGLLTPLAGSAALGAMLCAWAVNVSSAAVWSDPFNVPFLIGLASAALLFAGAGAYSVDARVPRPAWSTRMKVALIVLAFVVAVLTWVGLYGVNPIHFSTPPAPAAG